MVTVTRVIDGDPIEARFPNGVIDMLRLLGVDTPVTTSIADKNNIWRVILWVWVRMADQMQIEDRANSYHDLIEREFDYYQDQESFDDVHLDEEDFLELDIDRDSIETLLEEGYLVELEEGRYRTLHMDIAYRASDIRVQHEGKQYILENDLELRRRPVLDTDFVEFNRNSERFQPIFGVAEERLGSEEHAEGFFEAFCENGITGLSRYQLDAVKELLKNENHDDSVISAPTGFGKTYVFLIPTLLEALSDRLQEKDGVKTVYFYPRNALGSDQMDRLVNILQYLNRTIDGPDLSIGLDIGSTRYLEEGAELLGATCAFHGSNLVKKGNDAYCPEGDHRLTFIQPDRDPIYENPPDLLISNIWAWQHRVIRQNLWKNGYLGDHINHLVFDEVHEYRGIVAGVLKYFIQIIRELVAPNSQTLLSSATIPGIDGFVESLLSEQIDDVLRLVYDEDTHGKDREKYELYLLAGVNPQTSWETYTHQLAVYLSTVNRIKAKKNIQGLVFVDSIKNIQRLYSQTEQTIDLGDPEDHLIDTIPSDDQYAYWVYNREYRFSESERDDPKIEALRQEIWKNIEYHHASRPDRHDIEDALTQGDIDVTYSTSTLEVGVDYEKASVVVNAGIPFSLESIPQRVGRAGRNIETSLNTSVAIITVRNNPLEYMYLQRGLDNLISVEKMPSIPISDENHFVVLYSALSYVAARKTKRGQPLDGSIAAAGEVFEFLEQHEAEILPALGTSVDLDRTRGEIMEVVSLILEEDIDQEEILRQVKQSGLYTQVERIFTEIEDLLDDLRGKIDEIPKRDRGEIAEQIREISEDLPTQARIEDLDEAHDLLYELELRLDRIKSRIRGGNHPLHQQRSEIVNLSSNMIAECIQDLDERERLSTDLDQFGENENLYLRASEVLQEVQDAYNIIMVIESLVGFRYMGNEFIDHKVNLDVENGSLGVGEQSLQNVISRTPPFVMQNLPYESKNSRDITERVGGRHSWFINPKSSYMLSGDTGDDSWDIFNSMKDEGIAFGSTVEHPNMRVPQRIEYVDFLSRDPLVIKINAQTDSGTEPLYFKYGSERIVESKVDGKYPLRENVKRLEAGSHSQHSQIKDRTLEKLDDLEQEYEEKDYAWGINFDYVSTCQLGLAVSTDPDCKSCPNKIQEDCGICDGKKYWSSYRKMFPKAHVSKRVQNYPTHGEHPSMAISTVTYDELQRDIEFSFENVSINIPTKFNYYPRDFEIEPIGFRARTSLISLSLNEAFLEVVINNVLEQRPTLKKLLKYKFYMYQQFRNEGHTSEVAPKVLEYDSAEIDVNGESFRNFVQESLIHTLTHMLYIYVVKEVGVEPNRLSCHPQDDEVVIFEDAKRDGMGVVETIRDRIEKSGAIAVLQEFGDDIMEFLDTHDKHIEHQMDSLDKDDLARLKNKNEEIETLAEELTRLNEEIEDHTDLRFVDFSTYRQLVLQRIGGNDLYEEYLLPLVQAMGAPHLCYDGCNDCVILEHNCNEPFGQPYILSRRLLSAFLDHYAGGSTSIVRRGVGEILQPLLASADRIRIKTPFIDKYGVELLQDLVEGGADVELITRKEPNIKWVDRLESAGVEIIFADTFHTKAYHIRSESSSVLVEGSVNLQRKGFQENEENVTIIWDNEAILSTLEGIEEM